MVFPPCKKKTEGLDPILIGRVLPTIQAICDSLEKDLSQFSGIDTIPFSSKGEGEANARGAQVLNRFQDVGEELPQPNGAVFFCPPKTKEENHSGGYPPTGGDQRRFFPIACQLFVHYEAREPPVEPPVDPSTRPFDRSLVLKHSGDKKIAIQGINPISRKDYIHNEFNVRSYSVGVRRTVFLWPRTQSRHSDVGIVSFWIRSRIPLIKLPDSSDPNRFPRSMASFKATFGGMSSQ
jgi:hypothetical protein